MELGSQILNVNQGTDRKGFTAMFGIRLILCEAILVVMYVLQSTGSSLAGPVSRNITSAPIAQDEREFQTEPRRVVRRPSRSIPRSHAKRLMLKGEGESSSSSCQAPNDLRYYHLDLISA